MTDPAERAERAAEAVHSYSMWLRKVTLVAAVLALLLVMFFGVWDRVDAANSRDKIYQTLQIVKEAVDPNSQLSADANRRQAQVVRELIVCIEYHVDHRPTPPGCP